MPDPPIDRLGTLDQTLHQDLIEFDARSSGADRETDFGKFRENAGFTIAAELFQLDLTGESNTPVSTQLSTHGRAPRNQIPTDPDELRKWLLDEAPAVAARFEIVRKIGAGGMGTVYEVEDLERKGRLAMKILHHAVPEFRLRFQREFRFLSGLAHPNLVRLYEFFHVNQLFCFTMELVEGTDLLSWWQLNQQASSPQRLQNAFLQLAEGLNTLHGDGKLHRDIKPTNVMVDSSNARVVVLDFGLVTNYADRLGIFNPNMEDVSGTLPYMSPEQMNGLPLKPACDWYAFGVMLYESIAGRRPFSGSYTAIYQAKIAGRFQPLPDGAPAHLEQLCRDLLLPSAEDRPDCQKILEILHTTGAPGQHAVSRPDPKKRDPHIFGREPELNLLREVFVESLNGKPAVATIHGVSGIGKTAVLEAFKEELAQSFDEKTLTILSGRCYEQESIPYKGIDEVVDQMARLFSRSPASELPDVLIREFPLLSTVFPALHLISTFHSLPSRAPIESLDPGAKRRRMLTAFRDLLIGMSHQRQVVLFIDDLQWSDPDCIAVLESALHHSQSAHLLVVVAYRREEADRNAGIRSVRNRISSLQNHVVVDIPVDELDQTSLGQLAAQITREHSKSIEIDQIVESAKGSPFFLIQMASALSRGEANPALESVLENHLAELGPEERRFLELLAVAGRPLRREIAIEAADISGKTNLEVESDLRISRLIKSSGTSTRDHLETYHDRIREGIIKSLDPDILADHHLRLAQTLRFHTPEDHENLARHYRGAGEAGLAADFFVKAAEDSRHAFAFEHTVELFRTSLQCLSPVGAELATIREAIGEALANSGRGREAALEFHKAAKLIPESPRQLVLKQKEAHQYMISGHFDKGLRVVKGVLRQAGIPYPPSHFHALISVLAQSLWLRIVGIRKPQPRKERRIPEKLARQIDTCWLTGSGLGTIVLFRAADFHLRALRYSLRSGEPCRIARSLAFHSLYNGFAGTGSWKRTSRLLQLTESFAHKCNDSYSLAVLSMARSGTDMLMGRFENSVNHAIEAGTRFRQHGEGVTWEVDTVEIYRTTCLLSLGKLKELRELATQLAEDSGERGNLYCWTNMRSYTLPILETFHDNPDGALKIRKEAIDAWSKEDFFAQHLFGMLSYAEAHLYRNEPFEVLEFFRKMWPRYRKALFHKMQFPHSEVIFARARASLLAWEYDRAPLHLKAARRDSRFLSRQGTVYGTAMALSIEAGLATARGNRAGAERLLLDALEKFEEGKMGLRAAATKEALASLGTELSERQFAKEAQSWWESESIPHPAKIRNSLIPLPIS